MKLATFAALLGLLAVSSVAVATTARATYTQEAAQATTRASPTAATEGAALAFPLAAFKGGPLAAVAIQLTVATSGNPLPDAGPDYLTGGCYRAWRYNPTSGWSRLPSQDNCMPAVAFTDAGSGFPDGGVYGAQVRPNTWTFPEQSIQVVGPSDRFLFAGDGVVTAESATTYSETTEVVFSDPLQAQ